MERSSSPMPADSPSTKLRWPHYVAFALLLVGVFHLTSAHRREFLLSYSIAASLGYGFCRPRENGQTRWEYVKDPGNIAMTVLIVLGGAILVYHLTTGHF